MGTKSVTHKDIKGTSMRFLFAFLLGFASFLLPQSSFAESADVEAVIEGVDERDLTLTLDDGNKYQAPVEFIFEGLKMGV